MKKIILLLVLIFMSTNSFAAYTLVLTEQRVGEYKDGRMIPEENPQLFQHRIVINETFQTARIIEQTSAFDQSKLEPTNDKFTITYIDSGIPAGAKEKSICLTRTLPLATEVILIKPNDFRFISIALGEITISEGVVQRVLGENQGASKNGTQRGDQ